MIFVGNLMEHKNSVRMWDFVSMASILIMVIGIVVALYSTYNTLTLRQHFAYSLNASGYGRKALTTNGSGDNFAYPSGAHFVRLGLFNSLDMITVGILLLLLGFVSFKYANLKMQGS